MAWSINDIDFEVLPGFVLPSNGSVLGENSYAFFALKIHRVENSVGNFSILTKGSGVPQHCVDERRFSVIDMSDDRHITKVVARDRRFGSSQWFRGRNWGTRRLSQCARKRAG